MALAPVCPEEGCIPDLADAARRGIRRAASRAGRQLSPEDYLEDLVQETLLRFWTRYPDRLSPQHRGLAFQMGRCVALDTFRAGLMQKRRAAVESLDAVLVQPSTAPRTEEQLVAREAIRAFAARCRRLLTEGHFRVFTLLALAGLTSPEAGDILGLKPSAIDSQWYRLRRVLAGHGITAFRGGVS